jgi:hypothetical protein
MRFTHSLAIILALSVGTYAANAQKSAGNNGPVAQQSFNTGNFEGIGLGGPYTAVVKVGGATSVRAEGDADAIAKLDIKVEKGVLKIGAKKDKYGNNDSWNENRAPVTIYVTTPSLSSAAVAGSAHMGVDKIAGDSFEGAVAGSGDLEIASLRVDKSEFNVAGSGNLKAFGSVGSMEVAVAGAGSIDLAGVDSRQAEVSVTGSGKVLAKVSETANVSMIGSGDVTISGTAKCTINKRGSGTVNCGG